MDFRRGVGVVAMKCRIFILMVLLLCAAVVAAAMDSVEAPERCRQCGMNRTMFAQSRMLVRYDDGTVVGTCSLHCAAAVLHYSGDKQLRALMVADYSTQQLIEAGQAVWVVGGRKPGVMTAQPKWAFARGEDARKFIATNGGIESAFDQVMNAATMEVLEQAEEDKTVENEMLREMR